MFTALSYNYGFTVGEIMNMSLIHIEAYIDALNTEGSNSDAPVNHQQNMDIARRHGIMG